MQGDKLKIESRLPEKKNFKYSQISDSFEAFIGFCDMNLHYLKESKKEEKGRDKR